MKHHHTFGPCLRLLRNQAGQTLKFVAEELRIDVSLLAKIERGERLPNRAFIKIAAAHYKIAEQQLLCEFISDQIAFTILNEQMDIDVLKIAENKVVFLKSSRSKSQKQH